MKRNFLGGLGAFLILALVTVFSFLPLQKYCSSNNPLAKVESRAQPERTSENTKNADSGKKGTAPKKGESTPAALKLPTSDSNSGNGNQNARSSEEKKEDWTHKFWCETKVGEFAIALFTLLLVLFTGGLWWSTYQLWSAGEKQLAATQRPWVKVDGIEMIGPLTFQDGEARLPLRITVSNKGKSPGLRVRANVKLVASNQISLLQEQREFSAAFRRDPGQNEVVSELTSWPNGDTITFETEAWLSSVDMPRFKPLADNTPFPILLFAIVGCINYEFPFAPGHHQTSLIYTLRRTHFYPDLPHHQRVQELRGAIRLGQTVQAGDLRIEIGFEGTGPVD